MALHTKLRPKSLKDFAGNETLIESLDALLSRPIKDIPRAFLFIGQSGCGKTTLARIIKESLGCWDQDYIEIDASDDRGIESIRKLKDLLPYKPAGPVKVILLDEVHGITPAAQEAMLKMLEETEKLYPHVYFVLATTEFDKLKDTLTRRCFIQSVKPLNFSQMTKFIKSACEQEGIDPELVPNLIEKIVEVANGSPGIALKLLDQVIDMPDEESAVKAVESITYSQKGIIDICRVLIEKDSAERKWGKIVPILSEMQGSDADGMRRVILSYLEKVLFSSAKNKKINADFIAELMTVFTDSLYSSGRPGLSVMLYLACKV